jgi:hypothetical protein
MNDTLYNYTILNISPLPATFISITGNVMTFNPNDKTDIGTFQILLMVYDG